MKKKGLPHLFNEVLDAIAILKEAKGSSEKSILNQVDTILLLRRQHLKKSIGSIHKALRHGLQTGILKLKDGKYCLGMSQSDYNVFRKVRKLRSVDSLYKEFRRGRRRRGRRGRGGRRRRGRRRGNFVDDDTQNESDVSSCSPPSAGNSELVDRGRRGRRRSRRRRGRRRRRAAETTEEKSNDPPNEIKQQSPGISQKTSEGSTKSNNTNYKANRRKRRNRRRTEIIKEKSDDPENEIKQQSPVTSQKNSEDSIKSNHSNDKANTDEEKNTSDKEKSDNNDNQSDNNDNQSDNNDNQSDVKNNNNSRPPTSGSAKKCDDPSCLCNTQNHFVD